MFVSLLFKSRFNEARYRVSCSAEPITAFKGAFELASQQCCLQEFGRQSLDCDDCGQPKNGQDDLAKVV